MTCALLPSIICQVHL